ncbi:TAXI family TRAP transporter solute-binding subunit [Pelagibacteraceae bacterium]|nr:TAXI family TRAP transporter solute-binding subunit [Pelagibacteraceae bacterium]MDC1158936.1 TAXI family TRAP transporter solute-binding subunit [Pelagibacteraceae bacterium]
MKKIVSMISAFLVTLALSSPITSIAKSAEFFTIGTGGPTGVYFQTGNAICKMLHKSAISADHGRKKGTAKAYRCTAPSTGGSNYNIGQIKDGEFQFGVAQSDWQYHAYNGSSKWEGNQFSNLRAVFSVHNEPFQIWASKKSKIKDFKSLKGKVVNIGNPGSGQRGTMEELMKAMGVDNSHFKSVTELTSSEQVKALCDGKIDAFGYSVGFPNGAMEQAATCKAKASPINLTGAPIQGLISGADYYAKAVIPKGTYSNQKKDATTFGVKATVVTSADVSEELVYLVTKAVMDNFDDFKAQHPAFGFLKKEDMIKAGLSAPLHPGAIKAYKEAGLM